MLELIQFPRALGVMNPSPFCMKVEVFLKLAGLAYRVDDGTLPMRLPKGKLPALRDGGTLVCDSQAIVEHLQQRFAPQLPAGLRERERAADLALRRLFEEHYYFTALWGRWIDDAAFARVAASFFQRLPGPLRRPVAALVRRKMRRDLQGQGMGRHAPAEIAARACADLDAAQAMLGERPFFGGDSPSTLDCTAYAFLANALFVDIDNPVRRHLQAMAPLVAYCNRMAARVGR
jgi:glutathione S-transferase